MNRILLSVLFLTSLEVALNGQIPEPASWELTSTPEASLGSQTTVHWYVSEYVSKSKHTIGSQNADDRPNKCKSTSISKQTEYVRTHT